MYYFHRKMRTRKLSTNYADKFLIYFLNKIKMPKFPVWDAKFYREVHCARQHALWNNPVWYRAFIDRLKVMNLHDAIYTPRADNKVTEKRKYPIQDAIRRKAVLKAENIQIIDLVQVKPNEMKKRKPRIIMPKPKKTIWQKFISLFKK